MLSSEVEKSVATSRTHKGLGFGDHTTNAQLFHLRQRRHPRLRTSGQSDGV